MNWNTRLGLSDEDIPVVEAPPKTETIQEINLSTTEVHDACKNSMDFLAGIAMPTVFRYFFPFVFQSVWKWLLSYVHKERDFSQLALGLPRGFGKTSVIKLFVLYCILFTKKKFILIICGNQGKANNALSDIIDMLEEENIKKIFGDWKIGVETDRQDLKKFGFRGRNIILMGAGSDSDIRGIVLKNERPDVMIFDDIQSRDDADSEVISTQLETNLVGTAMKAKSPHGCLFIYIANMYPTKWSILRRLQGNPNWIKYIVGGILADGTSLWEDLQPISQLIKEYENDLSMGHPEVFFAEVLNDPNATVNKFIDISKIPENPYEDETLHQGNFIIIDPATDKSNADAVSTGYFEIYDGKSVLKTVHEGRLSPGESIKIAIMMCLENNCRLVAVESNAYQYSYLYWFNVICAQMGIQGIQCVDVYSGSMSKNSRIVKMFKALLAGDQYISNSALPTCTAQIVPFNPMKTNNTDGVLDLLTYAPKVQELYGEFIMDGLTLEMQEFAAIPLRSELETSAF